MPLPPVICGYKLINHVRDNVASMELPKRPMSLIPKIFLNYRNIKPQNGRKTNQKDVFWNVLKNQNPLYHQRVDRWLCRHEDDNIADFIGAAPIVVHL